MEQEPSYWTKRAGSALSRRGLLRGAALGSAGLAAAALVGCGGDDDEPGGSSGTTAPSGGTSAPVAEGEPKAGGTFRWDINLGAISLPHLPNRVGAGGSWAWKFDSDVAVRWNATATELVPELIDNWETTDGVEIIARPPEGVKTHNKPLTGGRLWDAEDVAINLEYISGVSDPANVATYAKRHSLAGLASAEAIDAGNARVVFSQPTPSFPQGLCDYHIVMLPRENFLDDAADVANNPDRMAATGPMILREYRPDEAVLFDANPDYWLGVPYLEDAEWRQAGDRVSQLSSFLQGNANYFENPSRVERDTVSSQMPDAQIHAWPGSTVVGVMFNLNRSPLDDPRVRHAMHLVTQFQRHMDDYWGEGYYTLGAVLNNAFPQGLPEDEVVKLPGWRPEKDADIAEAKTMMESAGYPDGAGLDLKFLAEASSPVYSAYDFFIRWIDDLRSAFPQGRFEMELASDSANLTSRINSGNFDVARHVSGSVSPAALELSTYYATSGSQNVNGYSNSTVDDLLERAITTLDSAEHDDLVKQAEAIILEEMPRFIVYRIHQAMIYGPEVRGFPTVPGGSQPLVGNFENWGSVLRHLHKYWLDV